MAALGRGAKASVLIRSFCQSRLCHTCLKDNGANMRKLVVAITAVVTLLVTEHAEATPLTGAKARRTIS